MGMEQVARFTVGYVYLSEFCSDTFQRPFVTTIAMFISAESAMICAIYFRFIGKNWEYFEFLGLSMAVISLFSVCFIPESPRWLISRGKFKRAFDVYKKVAKFNGVLFTDMIWKLGRNSTRESVKNGLLADPNKYIQDDEDEKYIEDEVAPEPVPDIPFDQRIDKPRILKDLLLGPKRKVFGLRFLALLILWSTYMYSYQVVEAFLQYTYSDVFTDTIALANAEAFGYVLAGFVYIKNQNRGRGIMVVTLFTTAFLTAITFAVNQEVDSKAKSVIVNLLIMAIRFSLSISFNALLLTTFIGFPTIYLCTVLGALNFLARLCGLIGPSHQSTHLFGAKIGMIVSNALSGLVAWRFLQE